MTAKKQLEERQIQFLLKCEEHLEEATKFFHLANIGTINSNRMLETLANAKQGLGGFLNREY